MKLCTYFGVAVFSYVVVFIYYLDFSNEKFNLRHEWVEILEHNGYHGEEYKIRSEDAFLLKMHRFGGGSEGRRALLFIPGIHTKSELSINLGPKQEMVYALFDAGFDVWSMNFRGSVYGLPDPAVNFSYSELNDFSFHEQGYYDLAASIDFVLEKTGLSKVTLVPTSMGSNLVFALLSTRPAYNEKVELILAFGPTGPFTTLTKPIQYFALALLFLNKWIMDYYVTTYESRATFCHILCAHPLGINCAKIVGGYLGLNGEYEPAAVAAGLRHMFTGPYMGIYSHIVQMIKAGKYVQRDFGPEENLRRYNSTTPPPYDMTKVTVPVKLYYAELDPFLTEEAKKQMKKLIPNVKEMYEVKAPFGHANFMINSAADSDLIKDVIETLKRDKL